MSAGFLAGCLSKFEEDCYGTFYYSGKLSAALSLHDTQVGIKTVKDFFQKTLSDRLNLLRVSAPLFVDPSSGLNDNLNGVERPVTFDIKESPEQDAEIVHSLAKWKRYALKKYGFAHGEGLYTDMVAIRRDEDTDNIHSIYVDQWDWEKIITHEERNVDTLKDVVRTVYSALKKTENTWRFSMIISKRFFRKIFSLSLLRNLRICIRVFLLRIGSIRS